MKKSGEKMKYVVVRCARAGVFAGELEARSGMEVTLRNARRLWYWSGAASLSELAMRGVKNPGSCKFPCLVSSIILAEVIEVIDATDKCRQSIEEVPEWRS